MLKGLIPAAAAIGLMFISPTAQAMPMGTVNTAESPHLTLVYGGCGPYGHRGPYGGCQPGGQWSGRPVVVVAPPICPAGTHLGRGGRACWPN